MLAKSHPSMVSTAKSTTARKVSAGLPAENRAWAVSEKLAVSSELRSSEMAGCSPVVIGPRSQGVSRIELYRASAQRQPLHLNVAGTAGATLNPRDDAEQPICVAFVVVGRRTRAAPQRPFRRSSP